MVKAATLDDNLAVLTAKISDLSTLLSAGNEAELDLKSDHTFYGVPEAVIDDINQAIDLIIGAYKKCETVTVYTA